MENGPGRLYPSINGRRTEKENSVPKNQTALPAPAFKQRKSGTIRPSSELEKTFLSRIPAFSGKPPPFRHRVLMEPAFPVQSILPFRLLILRLIPSGKHGNFTSGKEMTLQFLTKRYIPSPEPNTKPELHTMKVLSSLASMKRRHADCQIVKRKGTLYVICKSNPKFKARQGATAGTRLSKKGVK